MFNIELISKRCLVALFVTHEYLNTKEHNDSMLSMDTEKMKIEMIGIKLR
jgi:hypothetical protein